MRMPQMRIMLSAAVVILVTVAGLCPVSQGAPPATGSVPYALSGRVDYIDYKNNVIVVDDREFGLPVNVPVRSGSSTVSRSILSKGMRVGFNERGKLITEIWILSGR